MIIPITIFRSKPRIRGKFLYWLPLIVRFANYAQISNKKTLR